MDAMETGARIATERKKQGMTQKQLAEILNVTDKAVSKWECGKNFPDLTLLEPLAKTLNTNPAELLGLESSSSEAAFSAASMIVQQDKQRWLKELRQRALILLTFSTVLFILLILLSYLLDQRMVYGLPQALTGIMSGLTGMMIGTIIWMIRSSKKHL